MKDAHIETMPLYSAVSNCNSHHFIWYQITTKTTDIEKEPPISTLKNYLQAKRYLGIVNTQDKNHLHLLYKVKKKTIKQVLHLIFKIKRNKLIFTLYAYKAARISQWRISRILLTWKGLFKCIALQITACFVFFSTEGLKWKHEG